MKLINNPDRSQWAEILKRPVMNIENLFDTVRLQQCPPAHFRTPI